MSDLFAREQQVYDNSIEYLDSIKENDLCDAGKFTDLAKEYGKLLKQLRRVTKISDKTEGDLNTSKLDLLDKLHYDALTGIYNRRFMEDNLNRIVKFKSPFCDKLSVLMIDVDFFKRYNDTYGHSTGDECLKMVAAAIERAVSRKDDFVARYGGEEFVAVLPGTGEDGARTMSDRILDSVRACEIIHEASDASDFVTVSIGAATGSTVEWQNAKDYIEFADKALYMSKRSGRNKYTFLKMEMGT